MLVKFSNSRYRLSRKSKSDPRTRCAMRTKHRKLNFNRRISHPLLQLRETHTKRSTSWEVHRPSAGQATSSTSTDSSSDRESDAGDSREHSLTNTIPVSNPMSRHATSVAIAELNHLVGFDKRNAWREVSTRGIPVTNTRIATLALHRWPWNSWPEQSTA